MEQFFKSTETLLRLHEGPFGPYIESFARLLTHPSLFSRSSSFLTHDPLVWPGRLQLVIWRCRLRQNPCLRDSLRQTRGTGGISGAPKDTEVGIPCTEKS